jgi:hypothetical protein
MGSADREDMETGRRRSLGWAAGPTAAGLVVMMAAGVRAARYPLAGEERHLWSVVGCGATVVVLGVVLAAVLLPAHPSAPPPRPIGPGGHAALAGGVGLATSAVLVVPGTLAAFLSPHAWVAVLCGLWIGQAVALAALERAVGVLPRRAGWLTGLGAAGGALVTALGPFLTGPARHSWAEFVVLDTVTLAAVVLAVRVGTAWTRGPRPLTAALVLGLAMAAAVAVVAPERAAPPVARAIPSHTPSPAPVAPAQAPTPAPTYPAPVTASVPCAGQDLSFAVDGFDGAMGARAASLQATNLGSAPCWVEGTPVVVVMQGGRPLSLSVGPGRTPDGAPAEAQRVGLAPGGVATALLSWRSYGGWADLETPQSVATALDANSSLVAAEITGVAGPAPFDIADGGAWAIAPWAPPAH